MSWRQVAVLVFVLCAIPLKADDGWRMFERRLGMFVHWGIYAVDGYHEQQRMRQRLGRAEYAARVKGFTAAKFDPDRWIDVAESAGAEYIVFTAKHYDGFCMWDTRMTDFKVTNSPAKRDVLRELADACRRRGMKLGLYYSNPDWNHPNAYNPKSTHQVPPEAGDVPDLLKDGFHHVMIDLFETRMDDTGVATAAAFQKFLVDELGFAPKANLVGMSWGGFFSTRYAAAHPDNVDRIVKFFQ